MKLLTISLVLSLFVTESWAQSEGAIVRPGPPTSFSYSCDPNSCKIANNCACASKNPPNGLLPNETPQFVTVTFDDSIQAQLYQTAKKMLNVTQVD
ncbi:hypothetical protein A0J61_03334 [Choanephora cucurbitarum]|uniref:NodB homology domain-containing protein n=1 Tax=Choanephora cucurbitarum TaxID=101091 RepID=A0A1C7NHZ9_9FUNG|nr:hypothetical protein A0J61_03334 [Choanephora cucurbitarum]